jgi:hypothetical protein
MSGDGGGAGGSNGGSPTRAPGSPSGRAAGVASGGNDAPSDESTLGVLPWSVLICYRPPDEATLQVNYAEHDANVKRGDFKQFRYYPQVPHVTSA